MIFLDTYIQHNGVSMTTLMEHNVAELTEQRFYPQKTYSEKHCFDLTCVELHMTCKQSSWFF